MIVQALYTQLLLIRHECCCWTGLVSRLNPRPMLKITQGRFFSFPPVCSSGSSPNANIFEEATSALGKSTRISSFTRSHSCQVIKSLRVFCACSDGSVLRELGDGDHADGIRERPSGGGAESQFQQS